MGKAYILSDFEKYFNNYCNTDKQKTLALGQLGSSEVLCVNQTGTFMSAVNFDPSKYFQSNTVLDIRKMIFFAEEWKSTSNRITRLTKARENILGTKWKADESTGIHAEVMIIRYWCLKKGYCDLEKYSSLLRLLKIAASQPACMYCHYLMKQLKITHPAPRQSLSIPKTGWRHPLGYRTISNNDLNATLMLFNKYKAEWFQAAQYYPRYDSRKFYDFFVKRIKSK